MGLPFFFFGLGVFFFLWGVATRFLRDGPHPHSGFFFLRALSAPEPPVVVSSPPPLQSVTLVDGGQELE